MKSHMLVFSNLFSPYLSPTLSIPKLFIVFVPFSRDKWPIQQSIGLINKLALAWCFRSLMIKRSCNWWFIRSSFTLCSLPLLAPGLCNDFSFKCKDKQCVNKVNAECDRENDCSDGSDEQECSKSHCLMYFFTLTNKSEDALLVWTKHGQ